MHIKDLMNPPGMFVQGHQKIQWSTKDLLPFSGKLLTEFDRRRSIRDMFRKHTSLREDTTTSMSAIPTNISTPVETIKEEDISTSGQSSKDNKSTSPSKAISSDRSSNVPRLSTASQQDSPPPSKRRKPNTTTKDSNAASGNQKTLKSFFQTREPKNSISSRQSPVDTQVSGWSKESISPTSNFDDSDRSLPNRVHFNTQDAILSSTNTPFQAKPESGTADLDVDNTTTTERFIDPEESKFGWTKIFSKRDPPRCEGHNEPCISLETKKKGPNCGRRFWICPR
jgi:AP endonuclease 2